jgi:hypothetical protein
MGPARAIEARGGFGEWRTFMRILGLVVLVALTATVASCKKSSSMAPSPAPSPATVAGTWRATRAEFVSATNPALKVEVVSRGTTIVLVLESAGGFTYTLTDPGASPAVYTGTWRTDTLDGRPALKLTWVTGLFGSAEFNMTLSGDTLSLSGGHVPYDVDPNVMFEETILNMTLARQ